MDRKQRVLAAIEGTTPDYVPVCFSLHFGENTVEEHLAFFKETDLDICKIMNENLVPPMGEIVKPDDWNKIKSFDQKSHFIRAQLEFADAIRQKTPGDSFLIGTLHGITASAVHPIEKMYGYEKARKIMAAHLTEDKQPVMDAFKRITDGMCGLLEGYAQAGLDGVYYAALGGERHYFTDEQFEKYIKPFDQTMLSAARKAGLKTFLHICKENIDMKRYTDYASYCDVANWGVYETDFSLEQGRELFRNLTVMGGLSNRSGVLTSGTDNDIRSEVKSIIGDYGKSRFILGADCTLPTEIDYARIKLAVETARSV